MRPHNALNPSILLVMGKEFDDKEIIEEQNGNPEQQCHNVYA